MPCDSASSPVNASEGYVCACACLRVSHAELLKAIACLNIRTLNDLRAQTGAGDGCTACHRRLRHYLGQVADTGVSDCLPDLFR